MAKRNVQSVENDEYRKFIKEKKQTINSILGHKPYRKNKNKSQKIYKDIIDENEVIFCSGPAGTGKAQPLTSKILTPEGYRFMGEIKPKDFVIGSDGKAKEVLSIHPQGIKEVFEIEFSDGAKTRCTEDHLWYTETYYDRNYRKKVNGVRYSEPRKGTVKTTREIMDTLYVSGRKNHSIPIIDKVNFEVMEQLPMDSYILGVLLGDGSISTNNISFTSCDHEIYEIINEKLTKNQNINIYENDNHAVYSINGVNNKNEILNTLRDLKLVGTNSSNKFIPNIYKYSSIEDRIEVLQGLMDTDGYIDKRTGSMSYTTISKKLADDLGFIINSLGGIYTVSEKIGKYKDKTGKIKECNLVYTLCINLPNDIQPFKLTRKLNLFKPKTKYKPKRYIKSITKVDDEECQCISIDSHDSLYATDYCILTHNTYVGLIKAIELLMDPDNNYIRISLFRAPVEAGDNPLGFLPGDLNEKLFPYIEHVYDLIGKLYGDEKKNAFIKAGFIKPRSIGHSRGNNLDNEIVLVEEAQNLTIGEMKLLLTRIGSDCKMILSGDVEQTDTRIKKGTESGLSHCMERLVDIKGIGMHSFTRDEIVRNPIIGKILENLD